jgi:branched-chain amino acid transport system permease protein
MSSSLAKSVAQSGLARFMMLEPLFIAQIAVSGVTLGSVYALVGLGFVIIYKATRTLNFAHGEMLMLGAIVALQLHVMRMIPYWPTFLAVLVGLAVFGLLVERVSYRPLAHAPEFTVIMATVAVGAMIRSSVRITQEQQLSYFPPIFGGGALNIDGIAITPLNLGITTICLGLVLGFSLFFQFTSFGRAMRAVSENRDAASLVGIKVSRVYATVWAISAALAGAAGILIAPLILITPDMGIIANKAFIGAVLGGFTSLPGTVVGGLLLGVLENFVGVYISTAYKDVIIFLLLVAILLIRPQGLLGREQGRRV